MPATAFRRALIMVHGTNRNADHYFTTAAGAAFLGRGASGHSLSSRRALHPRKAAAMTRWLPTKSAGAAPGTAGVRAAQARQDPDLTSFDFVDADPAASSRTTRVFPNLRCDRRRRPFRGRPVRRRAIEMANRVHDTLGVPVTYVVANPSSYAWPDATRPQPVDDGAPDSAKGALGAPGRSARQLLSYGAVRRRRLRRPTTTGQHGFGEPHERLHGAAHRRSADASSSCRVADHLSPSARSIRCRSAASTPRARPWRRGRRGERAARPSSSI